MSIASKYLTIIAATVVMSALGAEDLPPIMQNASRRARVESQFKKQRELARNRDSALFSAFGGKLTQDERDALSFLYAYMPLQDMADHGGEFFLRAVRATLSARSEMPWGKEIPEDIFLSFVLPVRVNNENLDEARPELFRLLKGLVADLSIEEAILEVNHWCHLKATYRATDSRTSGPLSTIRTSWGRCGEESVLVVAALRAVGIPARQVYTPRWAHVDDNHAWVEAWVDGKWRYLGACEPEPMLDMAWFREPARRAMMVHTKVYGGSSSGDFKIRSGRCFDELQVLSAYAPTAERRVKVVDSAKKPVQGALVEFGIYNYAEFFPLASPLSDAQGRASLPSGKGDLRIWASKGDLAGTAVFKADENDLLIEIAPYGIEDRITFVDVRPPPEPMPVLPEASRDAREANRQRIAEETRVREAYMATFASEGSSKALAYELELDPLQLWPLLQKSQGNHAEITKFLRGTPQEGRRWAMTLLETISEKDLRDVPAALLQDHLDNSSEELDDLPMEDMSRFVPYVLSPRIHNELLTKWRSGIKGLLGATQLAAMRQDPSKVVDFIMSNIKIDASANCYGVPMRPMGVAELKVADPLGRDILFVAICRTVGIPARLEPGTSAPQFFKGSWKTVQWGGQPPASVSTGTVTLTGHIDPKPVYMTHFALARFKDGRFQTLDYYGRPWDFFQDGIALEQGYYCLTTGNRQDDGSVLVRQAYFDIKPGENRVVPLVMRPSKQAPPPLGKVDLSAAMPSIALAKQGKGWEEGRPHSLRSLSGDKGIIIAWLGDGEPTRHAMGDFERLREPMEKWGGGLALCLDKLPRGEAGQLDKIRDMAQQAQLLLDGNGQILDKIFEAIKRQPTDQLPVIIGVSKSGSVVFFSEGYRIGVGEQVLKAIRRMENMAN